MPGDGGFIESIVEFFRPYFEDFGYLIVGLAGLLENSIGTGLVFPGETLVILGGFYAATGDLSPVVVAMVASVAGIAGDNVGYLIGRRYGRRFFDRFGRFLLLTPKRIAGAEGFYRRHGGKTVFLGRFIPVIRSVGCLVAGMSGLRYGRFFLYDGVGAILWSIANTAAGYLLGKGYENVERYLGGAGLGALVLLVVLVAFSAWWRRRHLARQAAEAETTRVGRHDGDN